MYDIGRIKYLDYSRTTYRLNDAWRAQREVTGSLKGSVCEIDTLVATTFVS